MLESTPHGFLMAQSCSEEKACFAPSLRRVCGETTTQLIHDRGRPLVSVAGKPTGHGVDFESTPTPWALPQQIRCRKGWQSLPEGECDTLNFARNSRLPNATLDQSICELFTPLDVGGEQCGCGEQMMAGFIDAFPAISKMKV